ncbi:hypothetical protein ACTGVQ_06210, partial [Streptococcus suis]
APIMIVITYLLTKIESCSHIWQKIFVLQNLEKRFRFLCLNYTSKQTQSQHILFNFCLFFRKQTKNQHFTVGFDNFMIL